MAVQGLGAATVSPAALSIVTTTCRGLERRASGCGARWPARAARPACCSAASPMASWRWVLFVQRSIGSPRRWHPACDESRVQGDERSFDAKGAVTVTAGLALLVYVVDAANVGWTSTATLGRIAGALVLLAILSRSNRGSASR